ncbi:MAG TPA: alpha/beta hydrolase [Thermomicrobiales bacterium]|jgi:pimeloyl-ACP methyl ester carboxylesterase
MSERVIRENGLDIATQAFGDPAHAPVLLIMGAMASMLWWPQEFCERLAGRDRYVIRYDNRDTGRSTKYPPGHPPYTSDDLVDDAIRVLDGHGIPAAHLVGMSGGGVTAQIAALKHPSRVLSLTAIGSTPLGADTSSLPRSSDAYRRHSAAGERVDWSDRTQVIDDLVEDARITTGAARPFDEARFREFIARDYDRAGGYESGLNHFLMSVGDEWKGRLHELKAPLLVIHGTADPLFPLEHGLALSDAVAGATLVRIEGGGHELHQADWDTIIGAIVDHTGAG